MCDAIYITSLSVLQQVSLRLCVATALISCTSGCLALTGTSILNLTGPFCANNACIPYIVNRLHLIRALPARVQIKFFVTF